MSETASDKPVESDAGTAPPTGETLEQQLQTALAERDDYLDKWTRARADLENYRRRVQKEMDDDRKYAPLSLLKGVLPALDGLDRALRAAKQSLNAEELITGIEMVVKQFDAALGQAGVKPVAAVGLPFDPNLHEAIQQRPSADYPAMTVVDDVERGYTLFDRVVRPSKVIVSSGAPM